MAATKGKHTPGPWRVVEDAGDDRHGIYAKGFGFVAFCGFSVYPEQPDHPWTVQPPANARLLAAAPDLLEACEALVQSFEDESDAIGHHKSYDLARAALAKAGRP